MTSSISFLFDKYCRLCARPGEAKICLFDTSENNCDLVTKINECLPVNVCEEDDLPKSICEVCQAKVELLHRFRSYTLKAETKLMRLVKTPNPDTLLTVDIKTEIKVEEPELSDSDYQCVEVNTVWITESNSDKSPAQGTESHQEPIPHERNNGHVEASSADCNTTSIAPENPTDSEEVEDKIETCEERDYSEDQPEDGTELDEYTLNDASQEVTSDSNSRTLERPVVFKVLSTCQPRVKRRLWKPEQMISAINAVRYNHISSRRAALLYNVPPSTLAGRLQRESPYSMRLGRGTVFSDELEQDLCTAITDMQNHMLYITSGSFRRLAYEFAEINELKHPFPKSTKTAGKDWYCLFTSRHPEFQEDPHRMLGPKRKSGEISPVQVFFKKLKQLMDKHKFQPGQIFNVYMSYLDIIEDSNVSIVQNINETDSKREQYVPFMTCVSADGVYLPPMFIFPSDAVQSEFLNNCSEDYAGYSSSQKLSCSDTLSVWLEHFSKFVKLSENKVLILLDSQKIHVSFKSWNFCKNNNIILCSFPPYLSNFLQPLKIGFFPKFRNCNSNLLEIWLKENSEESASISVVAQLFQKSFKKCATLKNAYIGFSRSGIYPYNPSIVLNRCSNFNSNKDRDSSNTKEEDIKLQRGKRKCDNAEDSCTTESSENESDCGDYVSQNVALQSATNCVKRSPRLQERRSNRLLCKKLLCC